MRLPTFRRAADGPASARLPLLPLVGFALLVAWLVYFPPWQSADERESTWRKRIEAKGVNLGDADAPDTVDADADGPAPGGPVRRAWDFPLLWRKYRWIVAGPRVIDLDAALKAARLAVDGLALQFDPSKPTGYTAKLHAAAGSGVPVVPETDDEKRAAAVIGRAFEEAERSAGQFDPVLGRLYKAWHYYGDDPRVPTAVEMADARAHMGRGYLQAKGGGWLLTKAGVELEPGTLAHGALLDRAAEVLDGLFAERGLTGYLLYAGRDVRVRGASPEGPWSFPVTDPSNPIWYFAVATPVSPAFALVGADEHPFTETVGIVGAPKVYHRILDATTGFPGRLAQLVIVTGPSLETARNLARGVFSAGPNRAKNVHAEYPGYHFYTWDPDMKSWFSPAAPAVFRFEREHKVYGKPPFKGFDGEARP